MCLRVLSGPHVATQEFYVLKAAQYDFSRPFKNSYSYFRSSHQVYGNIYKARLAKKKKNGEDIRIGLHSLNIDSGSIPGSLNCDSFDPHFSTFENRKVIILCKIPKNAYYYIGREGDIVSNQLTLVEPIIFSETPFKDKINWSTSRIDMIGQAITKARKWAKNSGFNYKPC